MLPLLVMVSPGDAGASASNVRTSSAAFTDTTTSSATLRTGTWVDRTQEGWAMPLTVDVKQTASGSRSRTFTIAWSPQNPEDAQLRVSYQFSSMPLPLTSGDRVNQSNTDGRRQLEFIKGSNGAWNGNQFRVTITPVYNGVRAKPTVVTITLTGSTAYVVDQQ